MSPASAAVEQSAVLEIPINRLHESPSNPRKTFDAQKLQELAASIREYGVLEPVLARPHPTKDGEYELVFGARRKRAAKLAELETVPTMVRELDDTAALKHQLIENKDREDIHPLEEAAGYRELHEKHGVSIKDIAGELGKSTGYVYSRIALCKLSPKSQALYLKGTLSHGAAVAIARVPTGLQDEVVKELIPSWKGADYVVDAEEAERHIRERYRLKLATAPFDRGDEKLLPAAGACTVCPKRTGNQAELFADVKSADTCTDPTCFEKKRDAQWERTKATAETKGQTVIDDKAAKKLFPYGGRLEGGSKFVDLAEKNHTDPKNRTWKQILGKDHPPVTLARDDSGTVHELVSKEAAGVALKKIGGTASKLAPKKREAADPVAARQRKEAALRRKAADKALAHLVAAAEKKGATVDIMRLVVMGLFREVWAERIKAVAERRGLATAEKTKHPSLRKYDQALVDLANKMKLPELVGLAVELVASRDAYSVHVNAAAGDPIQVACKELGVNWAKCQAEAKAEVAAKEPKAKTKKVAKKKGRA